MAVRVVLVIRIDGSQAVRALDEVAAYAEAMVAAIEAKNGQETIVIEAKRDQIESARIERD